MECWLKRAVGTVGLLSLLGATTAFAAPLAGFALKAETHNFAFFSRGDARVDVRRPEEQLARVEAALGHRLSARVDYYIYDRAEDIAATTGRYAGGLTFPELGQIHSTSSSQDHEIVHVVAYQLGNPGPFFQEGLAVALGDHGRWQGQPVDRVARRIAPTQTLETLIAHFDVANPQEGYAVAGSFVSFLIKSHGITQVSHFFQACHGERTTPAAFAAIFGETMEVAGAKWARSL
jgi:hypothetical protein